LGFEWRRHKAFSNNSHQFIVLLWLKAIKTRGNGTGKSHKNQKWGITE
jgi:hypothetical protein